MKLLFQFCQLLGAEIGADRAGGGGGSILREFACNVKTGRRQRGETTRRRDLGELWGHTRIRVTERPFQVSEHSCAQRKASRNTPSRNFLNPRHSGHTQGNSPGLVMPGAAFPS